MFKALVKKQFLELNKVYFIDKKGKRRSVGGIIGYCVLFAFVFFSVGAMFMMVSMALAPVAEAGLDWFYFAIMGMIAIFLGVFGSVFNTFTMLYLSKDNELLLSMPIPPAKILGVRMITVYSTSLLYTALVWIPTLIAYWMIKTPTTASIVFSILTLFGITLVVHVLTCALGWVVALLSAKLKNKSYVTVLLSLVFLGAYYFVYFRLNELMSQMVTNADNISTKVRTWAYPMYQMGRGASGEILPFLIFTGIAAVLFAVTYIVLAKSFNYIATRNYSVKKAVYHEQTAKIKPLSKTLLAKELKRFTSSPTYMLNTGLGLIIMIVIAVFALIKRPTIASITEVITAQFGSASLLPAAIVCIVCMMASMNCVSACSVSLEGKNLYILQSLPVEPYAALQAKEKLHVLLNTAPALMAAGALGYAVGANVDTIVIMCACVAVYTAFTANAGLWLNLRHPNLTWTNEAVPIKQSTPVFFSLFGGWIISVVVALVYFFLREKLDVNVYLICVLVLFGILTVVLRRWLKNKGSEIFAEL
ncbi:MAG: hypothetical protein IJT91_05865 [Clostridia bacterium]|nr:hypothetical protein [Clostridia bacterium]